MSTSDQLETALLAHEAEIARLRGAQARVLQALDGAGIARRDGSRNLTEWAAARLDVSVQTGRDLVRLARSLDQQPELAAGLEAGEITVDRAVATSRLADAGADDRLIELSRDYDIAGVRRLAARLTRTTRRDEAEAYRDRFISIQPSFDESSWRIWGLLPGYQGRLVEKALMERADRFPSELPDGARVGRQQRAADALVALAQDSLAGDAADSEESGTPLVTVFVDADVAAASGGEAGAVLATGPRIGPETLEGVICEGRVEVAVDGAEPLGVGRASRVVPPRLRRHVLHRDGGCGVDGCVSRYRLQAHHKVPWSDGGRTDADNLVTLCWYHHHVVVHGYGFRIDPDSPPGRVRFARRGRGPP